MNVAMNLFWSYSLAIYLSEMAASTFIFLLQIVNLPNVLPGILNDLCLVIEPVATNHISPEADRHAQTFSESV